MRRMNVIWIGVLLIVVLSGAMSIPARAQDGGPVLLVDVQLDPVPWRVWWSPDETRLLTVHEDVKKVLDATTGEELFTLLEPPMQDAIRNVAYSPDGTQIATVCDDDHFRILDATTGEQLRDRVFRRTRARAVNVRWSPDGDTIVVFESRGRTDLAVWDVQTDTLVAALSHPGTIKLIDYSPDGSILLAMLEIDVDLSAADVPRTEIYLWDSATYELLRVFSQPGEPGVKPLQWTRDGARLLVVTAHYDAHDPACDQPDLGYSTIMTWDVDTGVSGAAIRECHMVSVTGSANALWVADDTRLLTWSFNGPATVRDPASGAAIQRLALTVDLMEYAWWVPDPGVIVTLDLADQGRTIFVWRVWDSDSYTQLAERTYRGRDYSSGPHWNRQMTRAVWTYPLGDWHWCISCEMEAVVTDYAHNELYRFPLEGSGDFDWNAAGDRLLVYDRNGNLRIWSIPAAE